MLFTLKADVLGKEHPISYFQDFLKPEKVYPKWNMEDEVTCNVLVSVGQGILSDYSRAQASELLFPSQTGMIFRGLQVIHMIFGA